MLFAKPGGMLMIRSLMSALDHRLQVLTDRIHVDTVNERRPRLQNMPGLFHKLLQVAAGYLRLQLCDCGCGRLFFRLRGV